ITDLLAYSRVTRQDLELAPVELSSAAREALETLKGAIEERRAEVVIEESLPAIRGHRITIVQVLTNLISNAVKFVAPGVRPRVRVRADSREQWVRLWVEDNGIGIAPEHQERIFKVFERLHR